MTNFLEEENKLMDIKMLSVEKTTDMSAEEFINTHSKGYASNGKIYRFPKEYLEQVKKYENLSVIEIRVEYETSSGTTIAITPFITGYRNGRWHVLVIYEAVSGMIPSTDLGKKTKDITTAEAIKVAFSSSLANEHAYDEIYEGVDIKQECTINTNGECEIFQINKDNTIETRGTKGSFVLVIQLVKEDLEARHIDTTIQYTANGADHWIVCIKDGKPHIYLANEDESKLWKLSHEIDAEYK